MDRTTKILLAVIALGLWANAGVALIKPAQAQKDEVTNALQNIDSSLGRMSEAFFNIAFGACQNKKLC